jgi:molecular chaperone GrpE
VDEPVSDALVEPAPSVISEEAATLEEPVSPKQPESREESGQTQPESAAAVEGPVSDAPVEPVPTIPEMAGTPEEPVSPEQPESREEPAQSEPESAVVVEEPAGEVPVEPARPSIPEEAGTPEEPASLEQPVSHEESGPPEPTAVVEEAASKAPGEPEPPAEPEKHLSLKQLVSELESDETGAVTLSALEEPAKEAPGEPELPLSPEPPAITEQPAIRAEFDQLKAERDQLLDRLARLQAEFENARKRAERERTADRDYGTGSVIEKFLPVVDNFELALKSSASTEQLRSGIELIVKQMEDILQQLQVTAIPALGAEFDPRYHEALGTVEREDLPDQHVAEEIRRGYKLRDRLLRPSLVRVASNPKQRSE